jgi:Uncharacterized protein conserved in bacteria (DUF2059)
MVKFRNFGTTIAAIGLIASPLVAQSSLPKNTAPAESTPTQKLQKSDRTSPVTAEDRALALGIVNGTTSKDDARALMAQFFDITPEQFIEKSPQMLSLEKNFPGIVGLLLKRMQVWMDSKFDELFEGMFDTQVNAIAQNLTTEQLQESAEFMQSDAGKAFIAITNKNVTFSPSGVAEHMGKKGKQDSMDAKDLLDFDDAKFLRDLFDLPDEQRDAVTTFFGSPTGSQFIFALDESEKARLAYVDQFIASHTDELETLTIEVFNDYDKGVR